MQCHKSLSAVVKYVKGNSPRCKTATVIEIRIGPVVVATATKGGKYSQEQALAEFRRNPKSFTKVDGGWEIATAMKLVA